MNFKLRRYVYASKKEKVKHFFTGLLTWLFSGSILLGILMFFMYNMGVDITTILRAISLFFIIILGYFTATRYWIAIGIAVNVVINMIWFLPNLLQGSYQGSIEEIILSILAIPLPLMIFLGPS